MCLCRQPGPRPRHRYSEEDGSAGPVRNHGADPSRDPSLAFRGCQQEGALPVPEPLQGPRAPVDTAIRSDRSWLGRECRSRQLGLRHAFDAPNEGGTDLQEDGQPSSGPVAFRASRWMTRSPFPSRSSCKPVAAATPSRSTRAAAPAAGRGQKAKEWPPRLGDRYPGARRLSPARLAATASRRFRPFDTWPHRRSAILRRLRSESSDRTSLCTLTELPMALIVSQIKLSLTRP